MTEIHEKILLLLANGYTKNEIAHKLGMNYSVVDHNCGQLYREIGVSRRMHAIRYALECELIPLFAVDPKVLRQLTPVERDIFECVALGLDSEEIAKLRSRSVRTILHQRTALFLKLGLHDASFGYKRAAVVHYAVSLGLLKLQVRERPKLSEQTEVAVTPKASKSRKAVSEPALPDPVSPVRPVALAAAEKTESKSAASGPVLKSVERTKAVPQPPRRPQRILSLSLPLPETIARYSNLGKRFRLSLSDVRDFK